jgi:hypothetical protein
MPRKLSFKVIFVVPSKGEPRFIAVASAQVKGKNVALKLMHFHDPIEHWFGMFTQTRVTKSHDSIVTSLKN